MIIQELSSDAVAKSLKKFLDDVLQKRTEERYRALNYYEGFISELEADISSYFASEALQQTPVVAQNITGKLVNSRAIAYKKPPQRSNGAYHERVQGLDSAMVQFERLTYLLGTMALLSTWDEEEEMVRYNTLTEFYPLFLPHESEPVAIIYPLFSQEKQKVSEMVYVYWSPDEHYKITQKGQIVAIEGNEQMINPYGIVPITYAHRHPMTTDWWREGASDIINMNRTVNIMLTEMSLSMRLQMLGQPVVMGIDDASRMKLGVDKPLILPEGSNFNFAAPGGDLQKYVEGIRFLVDSVAYNNNLKTKWALGRDGVTGEALKMLEIDLTEGVEGDVEMIWRPVEQKRFEIDRAILEVHGSRLPDEFSVDFSEPRFPASAREEREQWEWEWSNGLSSKADWFRHNNPDMNEEQIAGLVGAIPEEEPQEKPQEESPFNFRGLAT